MRNVSSKSPRRMPSKVAMIAMRRSHKDFDRASLVSGAVLLPRSQPPTICPAEQSTRSQLLMKAVLAR